MWQAGGGGGAGAGGCSAGVAGECGVTGLFIIGHFYLRVHNAGCCVSAMRVL
jgi:hypothetical protein